MNAVNISFSCTVDRKTIARCIDQLESANKIFRHSIWKDAKYVSVFSLNEEFEVPFVEAVDQSVKEMDSKIKAIDSVNDQEAVQHTAKAIKSEKQYRKNKFYTGGRKSRFSKDALDKALGYMKRIDFEVESDKGWKHLVRILTLLKPPGVFAAATMLHAEILKVIGPTEDPQISNSLSQWRRSNFKEDASSSVSSSFQLLSLVESMPFDHFLKIFGCPKFLIERLTFEYIGRFPAISL